MKKIILIVLIIVYFIVFILFNFFIKKSYIIIDDIIFSVSGNSYSSLSKYPNEINDKLVNIYMNDTKYEGYINVNNTNNGIVYYDNSFKKINNNLVSCINCDLSIVNLNKIGNLTISETDKEIIDNYFKYHSRDYSKEIKYFKKRKYDFNNDGSKESLFVISNFFDENGLKTHVYNEDIDGDYYEVAFIYSNGIYDIIFKTDINEENTSIFDLDYFFKINNNEKKNFYFKVYDYYDVDYLCGAIFSENENDYTKSISCQFSRSD